MIKPSPPPRCSSAQDHLSRAKVPFYVGVTMESLHAASTDQPWEARPRPRYGPIIMSDARSNSPVIPTGEDGGEVGGNKESQIDNGVETKEASAAFGARDSAAVENGVASADEEWDNSTGASGGSGSGTGDEGMGEERGKVEVGGQKQGQQEEQQRPLVKKVVHLNQLAVYWNPADVGNPCSMHLSDMPVEQAEVIMSRCAGVQGAGGGRDGGAYY